MSLKLRLGMKQGARGVRKNVSGMVRVYCGTVRYNGTYERSLSRKKEYTGGAWLLRDYGSGGRAKGGSDSAKKRSSNAVIGHIHPGPPLPAFFFFFSFLPRTCRGHAHTLTPAGYTVCRTRFILSSPVFNYVLLNSPSPFIAQHPILLHLKHPFDEDPGLSHAWDSSACTLGTLGSSRPVRTF